MPQLPMFFLGANESKHLPLPLHGFLRTNPESTVSRRILQYMRRL